MFTPVQSNIDTKMIVLNMYLLSNMASFWVSMLVFGGVNIIQSTSINFWKIWIYLFDV